MTATGGIKRPLARARVPRATPERVHTLVQTYAAPTRQRAARERAAPRRKLARRGRTCRFLPRCAPYIVDFIKKPYKNKGKKKFGKSEHLLLAPQHHPTPIHWKILVLDVYKYPILQKKTTGNYVSKTQVQRKEDW